MRNKLILFLLTVFILSFIAVVPSFSGVTPPAVLTGMAAYQAGSSDTVKLYWYAGADDNETGDLGAGSSYLIQYTSMPASVVWSTSNAQVVISTQGVAQGSLVCAEVTTLVPGTHFFRIWAKDDANNYSGASAIIMFYSSQFSYEIVDGQTNDSGNYDTLAVDRSGNLFVAYRYSTGNDLRVIKRTGTVWGTPVTAIGNSVLYNSMAVDANSVVHVCYNDISSSRELRYARVEGTNWDVSLIDPNVDVQDISTAVDGAGNVHVSYYDPTNKNLKYAKFNGVVWSTYTIDSTGDDMGKYSSLVIDSSGNPHIAYYDYDTSKIKYAQYISSYWALSTLDISGCFPYNNISMVLGVNGYAHLSFRDNGLYYAKYNGTAWNFTEVDTVGGYASTIALDGSGNPHIAHTNYSDLRYARFNGVSWSTFTVDSQDTVGSAASIAVDGAGNVHISYYDTTNADLKIAHWNNTGFQGPMGGSPKGKALAPAPVWGLAVGVSSITWTWTDNSSNETGFKLYVSSANGTGFNLIANTNVLTPGVVTRDQENLTANTSYQAYVVAINAGGVVSSSATICYTLTEKPFSTVISSVTQDVISVNWSPNGNPEPGTTYQVYMSTAADFTTQSITVVSTSGISVPDLLPDSSYYFKVRAVNGGGVPGMFDVTVNTRTLISPDFTPPGMITGLVAKWAQVPGKIKLEWVTPGDNSYTGTLPAGSSYRIQYSTINPATVDWSTSNATVAISTQSILPGTSVTAILTVPADFIYCFRVWACDEVGTNYSVMSATVGAYANPFDFEVVDVNGSGNPRIAVDKDNNLHVAFNRGTGLSYIKRTGSSWGSPVLLDNIAGYNLSIAVDGNGNPHVSYSDNDNYDLKYAGFNGVAWSTATIDSQDSVGNYNSIAIDGANRIYISYYYWVNSSLEGLKLAFYNGVSWTTSIVDTGYSNSGLGTYTSLALDGAGNPSIVYSPTRYAKWTGSSWNIDSGASVGVEKNLTLDANGNPYVAYNTGGGIGWLYCTNKTDGSWNGGYIDPPTGSSGEDLGRKPSIMLDGNGNPQISYINGSGNKMKYTRYTGSSWFSNDISLPADSVTDDALAVDGNGDVHIAYIHSTVPNLKAGHWTGTGFSAAMGGNARSRAQAPSAFSATAVYVTSASWRWIDNASNEIGFRIYTSTAGGNFVMAGSTSVITAIGGTGSAGSYVHTGLMPNTSYQSYVTAVNNGGVVPSSSCVIWTLAQVPNGSYASLVTSYSVTLIWPNNSNPDYTRYGILRSTDNFSTVITVVKNAGSNYTSTNYTDTTVEPFVPYYYQVCAFNQGSVASAYDTIISTMLNMPKPAPENLYGLALSTFSIKWEWDLTPNATYYQLFNTGNNALLINLEGNGTTTWIEVGLSSNTQYTRYAKAGNLSGISGNSSNASRYTLAHPPEVLTAVPVSSSTINLAWDNTNGASKYAVRFTTAGFSAGADLWYAASTITAPTVNYQHTALNAGVTYYYKIFAVNAENIVNTQFAVPIASTRTIPAPVTYFDRLVLSTGTITWGWNDIAGEDGYILYRSTDNSLLATLNPGVTYYTENGLTVNAQFGRYVKAFNTSGFSAQSAGATYYTLANAPLALNVVATSTRTITIQWSANSNPGYTRYGILRSDNNFASTTTVKAFSDNYTNVSSTDTQLIPATTYYYKVLAINENGIETVMLAVTTKTVDAPPLPPENLFAAALSTVSIKWEWDITPNATYYMVFNAGDNGFLTSLNGNGTTTWMEINLSSNTQYTRYVKAGNSTGISGNSSNAARYTLAYPPATLSAAMLSSSTINISWDRTGGATKYKLAYTTAGFLAPTDLWYDASTIIAPTLNYQHTDLIAGLTYYYYLSPVNAEDANNFGFNFPTALARTIPSPVTYFDKLTLSTSTILWGWNDIAGEDGYMLYNCANNSLVATLAAGVTYYPESNLTANTQYGRYVKAFNSAGFTAQSLGATYYTVDNIPDAPSGLNVIGKTTSTITWGWTDNASNETGYAFYLIGASSRSLSVSVVQETSGNLLPNTSYSAYVAVFNTAGTAQCAPLTAWTYAQAPIAPLITAVTTNTVSVAWQADINPANTTYQCEISTTGSFTSISSITTTGLLANFTSLALDSTYYFRIKAFNMDGAGTAYSAEVSTKTDRIVDLTAPDRITNLTAYDVLSDTGGVIYVQWDYTAPADIDGYTICWAYTEITSTAGALGSKYVSAPASWTYVTNLIVDTEKYYFAVTAKDTNGNMYTTVLVSTGPVTASNNTVGANNDWEINYENNTDVKVVIEPNTNSGRIINISAPSVVVIPKITIADEAVKNDEGLDSDIADLLKDTVIEFNTNTPLTSAVTIVLSYKAHTLDSKVENNLRVFRLDEANQKWVMVAGTHIIDKLTKTVKVPVYSFSVYRIMALAMPSNDLNNLKVYPNPYKEGSATYGSVLGITFENITEEAQINIYNISGELVFKDTKNSTDNFYRWNLMSTGNEKVSAGVYVYIVLGNADKSVKRTGKFAVVK